MTTFHVLAATSLATVGLLHSIVGELVLIRPLIADDRWRVPIGRRSAELVLRFAWHITTIAWLGLAATTIGIDGPVALTAVCLASAVVVLALMPSHLSWPLFLLTALWAARAAELATPAVLTVLITVAAAIAVAAAVLHVVWASGRASRSASATVPTTEDGVAMLRPTGPATVLVAVALLTYAAALTWLAVGPAGPLPRITVAGATLVLMLRAAGDGRYVGFTKQVRATRFARLDDAVYTPIVVALGIGGAAALAL